MTLAPMQKFPLAVWSWYLLRISLALVVPAAGSSPLDGHPAPDFTLAALSTHPASAMHLASLKGKPVVLNFWASWCDPCKREAPIWQSIWQRVRSQGIVFIGVNYQDAQSDALNFLRTYGISYSNGVDPGSSTAISYGVTGIPETVFIDRRGVVVPPTSVKDDRTKCRRPTANIAPCDEEKEACHSQATRPGG
ncbi:MAG: TlpA family protein disulfide reductase [Ktedonobacteraceae bacterium]